MLALSYKEHNQIELDNELLNGIDSCFRCHGLYVELYELCQLYTFDCSILLELFRW